MPRADFQPVIGLEVHAQLLTRTKLFSRASTSFGAEPNANTLPLCLALPGSLPVLNAAVVELAIRTGLALDCTVNEVSEWSRKHYFYADLPKGFQITQYEHPICEHGGLDVALPGGDKRIRISRIHIEEDAGKSVHDGAAGASLIDLNRAGTPLLEIVSEPDLRSAEEAAEYLRTLRGVLLALGVNDGNLEEGSFRCDANVSVMRHGATAYGTRVELKNLNSFRFVQAAIEVEIDRHVELIESGGAVEQETRLYDPDRNETKAMRSKEDAHDYRYFPEPDLPPLVVSAEAIAAARAALPELPRAKQRRYVSALGLSEADARFLTQEPGSSAFFEAVLQHYRGEAKKAANWMTGELARLRNASGEGRVTPGALAELLTAVDQGRISSNAAKEVLGVVHQSGEAPSAVIAARGLEQVSDTGAIEKVVDEVLAKNAADVAAYRGGNQKLLGHFMGQVMKAMKGKGNPQLASELLKKKLGG
ncbi:MAG: Asp-tRNA(Asn)/Glu-tRNA(Gln) amidotransferase subunit GatB [Myxococcaceae bacterium]|nr:Asp-tRNA(Asn)/Glu-tRNA(Gln) amidotransferase subunit GatB [Myxococcaceae bacterium]